MQWKETTFFIIFIIFEGKSFFLIFLKNQGATKHERAKGLTPKEARQKKIAFLADAPA